MTDVPPLRRRAANDRTERADGAYVLYWMVASRRTTHNAALDHAVARARALDRPLIVLEALRCGHAWASARTHRFVLDGMADNARALRERGVAYHPYVEPEAGTGAGLLEALASRACLVVTDDWPCLFVPRMIAAAARRLDVRLDVVDGNGLLPLAAAPRAFPTAHGFRRHMQRTLPEHLLEPPAPDPLDGAGLPPPVDLPADVLDRWPAWPVVSTVASSTDADRRDDPPSDGLDGLPIDHAVAPVAVRGGAAAASAVLDRFLRTRLSRYAAERNRPEADVTSGLSPYLHFGHVGVHAILDALARCEGWSPRDVGPQATGARRGWWHMDEDAEAFLDELVTWRELAFNGCAHLPDHDRYGSLPDWARRTLAEHAGDPRPHLYDREAFETASTHDPIWNAAQNQLRREGRIHGYLRMLWGKKILHWSESPRTALEIMIELNNRWALDGRDPNSYAGIFWVLGRYDRAWGPERPVFGKIRYMSSDNTARKMPVRGYVERYAPAR